MLEGMRDMQQKRELQEADIQHLRAMNDHLKSGDEEKLAKDQEYNRHNEAIENAKNSALEATAPRNLGGGLYGYYNPKGTGPNQKGEWSIQENPEAKFGRSQASRAAAQAGMLKGIQPDPTGKTGGRYMEIAPGQNVPEGFKPMNVPYADKQADKEAAAKEKWVTTHLDKPGAVWMMAGIKIGDKDTAQNIQKLNTFYDSTKEQWGISPGFVKKGYEYIGGDPSLQTSWVKQ